MSRKAQRATLAIEPDFSHTIAVPSRKVRMQCSINPLDSRHDKLVIESVWEIQEYDSSVRDCSKTKNCCSSQLYVLDDLLEYTTVYVNDLARNGWYSTAIQ
jgi:hypothetical protein